MPITRDGNILLITNSQEIKTVLRSSVNKIPNNNLKITKYADNSLCKYNPSVLFIDDKRILDKDSFFKILRDLRRVCNFHSVLITPNYTNTNILEMFSNGIDYVLELPINTQILDALLSRYLNKLNDCANSVIHSRGISLFTDSNFAIYRNCKIYLTHPETMILHILMERDTLTELILLRNALGNISERNVRANISRIRKKFIQATGLNIIGNVYSKGYYLNI
jgi:DNA-binding response OmpR family regulator